MGVAHIMDYWWECHICGERRPTGAISIASHVRINAYGHEATSNVRYCNDREDCRKVAHVRDSISLSSIRLAEQRDALRAEVAWLRARAHLWLLAGFGSGGLAGYLLAGFLN